MKLPGENQDPIDLHFRNVATRMESAYRKSTDLTKLGYRPFKELKEADRREIFDIDYIMDNPEERYWIKTAHGWVSKKDPYRFDLI